MARLALHTDLGQGARLPAAHEGPLLRQPARRQGIVGATTQSWPGEPWSGPKMLMTALDQAEPRQDLGQDRAHRCARAAGPHSAAGHGHGHAAGGCQPRCPAACRWGGTRLGQPGALTCSAGPCKQQPTPAKSKGAAPAACLYLPAPSPGSRGRLSSRLRCHRLSQLMDSGISGPVIWLIATVRMDDVCPSTSEQCAYTHVHVLTPPL